MQATGRETTLYLHKNGFDPPMNNSSKYGQLVVLLQHHLWQRMGGGEEDSCHGVHRTADTSSQGIWTLIAVAALPRMRKVRQKGLTAAKLRDSWMMKRQMMQQVQMRSDGGTGQISARGAGSF